MPGTLLLADLERNNSAELNDHLQSLFTPDATQVAPVQPTVTIAPPEPPQPPQELQDHLDSLLTPDATQAPPAAPAPTPEPARPTPPVPAPTNVVDELASHVENLTGGGLKLLGQGMNALGQGAQEGVQAIGQGLTSLREPPARQSVVPALGPGVPTPPAGPGPSGPLQDYARQSAARAGIDPDIFVRQIQQESGFNPKALSPAGAAGIAQIVPRYHPGVDPSDPYASLDYAANLMRSNLGKYQGDYAKALAAYNAGAGAVDRFGGVPPFEETQRYVSTILSGQQPGPRPETAASQLLGQTGGWAQQAERGRDVSQFGDSQLTADEATAACGPAAAVRFAQRFGRNPTLREATDLAKTVGWTSAQGMAGLSSEKALMDKMGVATKLVSGGDWGTFANEARTGNPVTISTQGHYFTADGWDPATNKFHVGRSGLDLRGGSEWMTPEQMTSIMGAVQGGLLADNPTVPASTVGKTEGFTAPGGVMQAASTGLHSLGEELSSLGEQAGQGLRSLDQAVQTVGSAARDALTGAGQVMQQGQDVNVAGDVAAAGAVGEAPGLSEADRSGRREAVANAPVLGGALGMARGPELLSDQEIIGRASPEALEVGRELAKLGGTAEPTDADIANVLRSTQLGEAYAGTHTGAKPGGIDYDALAQLRKRTTQAQLPGTPAVDVNLADRALAFTVNNVLSNPASLLANAAGGLMETVKRPLVTAATGNLGAAGADLRAMGLAVGDTLADAATTFGTGRRLSRAADQPEAFAGAAGVVATPFLRVMGATDEFVSGLNSAGAQASKLVQLMRANPKLTQAEVLQNFQKEILEAGQAGGAEAVFQTGGSGIGESLARARRQLTAPDATVGERIKGGAAQVLVPFSSVPDVILTRGALRIPGINEFVTAPIQVAKALQRGDPAAAKRAGASAALATMTNFAIWTQVQEGNITGSGPDDPAKKRALMNARDANGDPTWRPNSIRVGGQWVPYSSLGGVAVQIGAIANAVEQYEDAGRQINPDMAKAFGSALGDTITDAWYLQTLSGVFRSIQNGQLPEWAGTQALSTAGRAIPESAFLNTMKKLTDPTAREAEPKLADPRTWLEYFQARTPLSEGLEVGPLDIPEVKPKLDPATGRPIVEPQTIPSALTRGTAPGEPNPVNELLARHNLGAPDPPKTITTRSGATIALTEAEQRRYLEVAGPEIEKLILEMGNDPDFQQADPKVQRDLLQKMIGAGRRIATATMFEGLSEDELLRRIEQSREAERRQAEPSVRLP